ncbi:hypothetical protein A2U01_0061609, partial [Trifolium medium]|nr:hypothetical protein [Trifolium medium]
THTSYLNMNRQRSFSRLGREGQDITRRFYSAVVALL